MPSATIAAPAPVLASPIPRGEIGVSGFYATHFMGAVFPLTAGLMLYGWHAAVVLAGVAIAAAISVAAWRRIGPRGRTLHYPHSLWFALLLALMLPAEIASPSPALWPLIPLAGLLLVILLWLLGGLGSGYVHPAVAAYLILVICYGELLVPHRILTRDHLLDGELFRSGPADSRALYNQPWINRRHNLNDSDFQEPAGERLTRYTSGREVPSRKWLPLSGLLRDSLPPLEDFIIAGQPGPIGASSVIAVIIGGLFLLYRGVIDFRVPLLACLAAYAALLILPIPAVIADAPQWRWATVHNSGIGWSVALTFVNYEIMASPLVFTAFFLATAPAIRPMTRRGRAIYAIAFGIVTAAFQLYVSASYGPYLALLIVGLLASELDRWFKPRPLV